jgi:hypothetical protein
MTSAVFSVTPDAPAEHVIEGFQAYAARAPKAEKAAEPPKPAAPIFGRRTRRYSNRL